jgi:secreted trypsin-like serine protease
MSGKVGRLVALAAVAAALGAGAGGVANAADRQDSERIISGAVADPAQWPSIAAMYFRPKRSSDREFLICGGTVIAPRFVLTAAHCVEGARPSKLAFVVGRPVLSDKSVGQRIPVRSYRIDPDYKPPFFRGDFAVLELRADAPVTPAILPNPTQDEEATRVGSPVRVAGWGGTKPNGAKLSKTLLTASESVIGQRACRRFYMRAFSSLEQICVRGDAAAGGGVNGACYGDSGGPLMADTLAGPLLVGVVSGGGDRCATQPEYYSRVSSGLDFIRRASGVVPATP